MSGQASRPGTPAGRRGGLGGVAAFTASYLLAALLITLERGNHEFLLYIAVMLVLIAAVLWMHHSIGLPGGLLWSLAVWGLAHMAGGLVAVPRGWPVDSGSHVLYSLWLIPDRLKYDHVVHAYGFGVTTWLCWHGLSAAIARRGTPATPTLGLMTVSASAGMGLGALNELIEFAATLLVPETNVGGYTNTGWDLAANFVGATFAAVLIASRARKPSGPESAAGD